MRDLTREEHERLTEVSHMIEGLFHTTDAPTEKKFYLELFYRLLMLIGVPADESREELCRGFLSVAHCMDQIVSDADVLSPEGRSQLNTRIMSAFTYMVARSQGLAMDT